MLQSIEQSTARNCTVAFQIHWTMKTTAEEIDPTNENDNDAINKICFFFLLSIWSRIVTYSFKFMIVTGNRTTTR